MEEIELYDVELKHDIIIKTGYNPVHVLIFMDKNANTYSWVTQHYNYPFEIGGIYDIKARLSEGNKLSYVRMLISSSKSEQPHPHPRPNAEDVLLGLASY